MSDSPECYYLYDTDDDTLEADNACKANIPRELQREDSELDMSACVLAYSFLATDK